MKTPLRIAVIGMGGFAGWHHDTILRLEARREARLICTCDPHADAFAVKQREWRLAERGVRVFDDHRAMLAACHRELDLLVVPTPIPLHLEMHRAGVELGLAVYLEKPPTLDWRELEEMIARDRSARKATLVGFNFIVEKPRLALKTRLLAGEFGALREARLVAQWARPASYFRRNNWAGRLKLDGHLVLDSCMGNAVAHFVHNLLFWAGGPELLSWAPLAAVRAELYRAHAIEGPDTFFVAAQTTGGLPLRIALTHACPDTETHAETVICEHATLTYIVGGGAEIRWRDGRVETLAPQPFDGLLENHLDYYRYLRGETPRPATTLADAQPFVTLNDLAYVSSGEITPFPAAAVTWQRNEKEGQDYPRVAGLALAISRFLADGAWPGAAWNRPAAPATVTAADLPRLAGVIDAMAAAVTRR